MALRNERLYWFKLRDLGKDTDCGRYKIMIHAEAAGEAAAEAVNHVILYLPKSVSDQEAEVLTSITALYCI